MWHLQLLCIIYSSTLSSLFAEAYVTQTVYGFLDFTTTIDSTVMVFSPQSAPYLNVKQSFVTSVIKTDPYIADSIKEILPTKLSSPHETNIRISQTEKGEKSQASFLEKNLFYTEYDHLSRQPEQFVEETFRVINQKPHYKQIQKQKIENKRVNSISREDEQILLPQSSTFTKDLKKSLATPTLSLRVLKTVAPVSSKAFQLPRSTLVRMSGARLQKRQKTKLRQDTRIKVESLNALHDSSSTKKGRARKSKRKNHGSTTFGSRDQNSLKSSHLKIQPSIVDTALSSSILKLNRTPGRWQYKTSPKPRVTIRKSANDVQNPSNEIRELSMSHFLHNLNSSQQNPLTEEYDLQQLGSQTGAVLNNLNFEKNKQSLFAETLSIDISTPIGFENTYYEIATIRTPYIFQAGNVKKTRLLTVTSTFEKTIPAESQTSSLKEGELLIENILQSVSSTEILPLEGSIRTLSSIRYSNGDTPSLTTVVETFNSTSTKLITQILPIVRDENNETSYLTIVQRYNLLTVITATKTLPPLIGSNFGSSQNFKDFSGLLDEAGSELNLDLEFGDSDNSELKNSEKYELKMKDVVTKNDSLQSLLAQTLSINFSKQQFMPPTNNIFINSYDPLTTLITKSNPFIVLETMYESFIVPIINGKSTSYRTLSKSIGAFEKTKFKTETATVYLPSIANQHISANPFILPQIPQFQTLSSPVTYQTVATQINSKILKLTFGAKTAYTTIYSTELVPTAVTKFITTSLPFQQTAAFPGYFPSPYNTFPFAG